MQMKQHGDASDGGTQGSGGASKSIVVVFSCSGSLKYWRKRHAPWMLIERRSFCLFCLTDGNSIDDF